MSEITQSRPRSRSGSSQRHNSQLLNSQSFRKQSDQLQDKQQNIEDNILRKRSDDEKYQAKVYIDEIWASQQQRAQTEAMNMTFENETVMKSAESMSTPIKQNNKKETLPGSSVKKPPTIMQVEVNAFAPKGMVVRQLTYQPDQRASSTKRSQTRETSRIRSQAHTQRDDRRSMTPLSKNRLNQQQFGLSNKRDQSPAVKYANTTQKSMNSWLEQAERSQTLRKSSSAMYLSVRKHSVSKKSIISQLHPKDQKLSIDYFLGTAKIARMNQKAQFKETIQNVIAIIQQHVPNGQDIVNNLKVIFFEHSQFIEGGTMGSSTQPINQNMMTLYLFHQFLKRYCLVYDHRQSHNFEMMFLEVSNRQIKKIDFTQFGSVLAKIAMKMYVDDSKCLEDCDPVEYALKLIHEFLFNVNIEEKDADLEHDEVKRDHSPGSKSKVEVVENEFERCKQDYEQAKQFMLKDKKLLEQIFNGYTKASKRGMKIIPLRQFKWMMRDLQIIPHITTEYKCAQLFKYLDSSKKGSKDYPEEICTFEVFPLSVYIVFSLILEDETDVRQKTTFIMKWLKEHSKDKLAGVHANREDRRIRYTNEKLAKK